MGILYLYTVGAAAVKFLYDSYKTVDSVIDVVRLGIQTANLASIGVNVVHIAFAGLNTAAGGLSIASCVFDVLALPFDFIVIVKGAYNIHKYRTGKGSNSSMAKGMEQVIRDKKNLWGSSPPALELLGAFLRFIRAFAEVIMPRCVAQRRHTVVW